MHFRIVLLYFYANYYIYALCIITLIFTWSRHKIAVPSMTRLYSYLTNQNMFSSLFDSQFNILTKYKESLDENMNPRYPSNENMNLRIWIFDILRMRIWIWEYRSLISFEWEYSCSTLSIVPPILSTLILPETFQVSKRKRY